MCIQAPGIKKLPHDQGKMFYSEAGRQGQLTQVEREGFVPDKVGVVLCMCVCCLRACTCILTFHTHFSSGTVPITSPLAFTSTRTLSNAFAATNGHFNYEVRAFCHATASFPGSRSKRGKKRSVKSFEQFEKLNEMVCDVCVCDVCNVNT